MDVIQQIEGLTPPTDREAVHDISTLQLHIQKVRGASEGDLTECEWLSIRSNLEDDAVLTKVVSVAKYAAERHLG
jgi:hypothetical protein